MSMNSSEVVKKFNSVSDLHALQKPSSKILDNVRKNPSLAEKETTVEQVVHMKRMLSFDDLSESFINDDDFERFFP